MKKLKELLFSSRTNTAAVALVAGLSLVATIGVARAAIETYSGGVEMNDIGVSLAENGEVVSGRDYDSSRVVTTDVLLANMLGESGGKLALGHSYNEMLNVYNSGSIDEYVRVSIYRYWVDPHEFDNDGEPKKVLDLDPSYIELNLITDNGNGWTLDRNSSTSERIVLYYQRILPVGKETPLFSDTLTISSDVAADPKYDGMKFIVRVDVDGVQTHNADDAIQSVWGIDMSDYGIQ